MPVERFPLGVLLAFFLTAAVQMSAVGEDPISTNKSADAAVFRAPFKLKLHVDKEHYYEQDFGKIPYVHQSDVYLFKDDEFGVNLSMDEGRISKVTYQPDQKKADVTLKFTEEVQTKGETMMILVLKNQSTNKLFIDALMTVPGKESVSKTTILPLKPRLDESEPWSSYESWPHPIVQLILRNIRLNEKIDNERKVEPQNKAKSGSP